LEARTRQRELDFKPGQEGQHGDRQTGSADEISRLTHDLDPCVATKQTFRASPWYSHRCTQSALGLAGPLHRSQMPRDVVAASFVAPGVDKVQRRAPIFYRAAAPPSLVAAGTKWRAVHCPCDRPPISPSPCSVGR